MTALPATSEFNGSSVTEGQFKAAIANLRDFLAGLLGSDGVPASALAALSAMMSSTVAKSAAYTVVSADRGRIIEASGTWTLALTAVATLGSGFGFSIRNNGSGIITIDPSGGEQINAATTVRLAAGQAVFVVCNGSAWFTIGGPGDDNAAFLAITGKALQSSAIDTTAGRLMAVGAFGWGCNDASISTISDLDAHRVSGFFRWTTGATGAPDANSGVLLHIPKYAGTTIRAAHQQLGFGSYGELYFRTLLTSGAWSEWMSLPQVSVAGKMMVAGNAIGGVAVSVADDAVAVITPPRSGGFAHITCAGDSSSPLPEFSGALYFDAGTTLQIVKSTGYAGLSASLNVSTADVAGTTGTDGAVTIAVQSGALKIENRSGASRTFQISFH